MTYNEFVDEELSAAAYSLFKEIFPLPVKFIPANGMYHTYQQQRSDGIVDRRADQVAILVAKKSLGLDPLISELRGSVQSLVDHLLYSTVYGKQSEKLENLSIDSERSLEFNGIFSMLNGSETFVMELFPETVTLEHRNAWVDLIEAFVPEVTYATLEGPVSVLKLPIGYNGSEMPIYIPYMMVAFTPDALIQRGNR